MNRLPREILYDIFGRLDFKDNFQSALACRVWYTTIINTVLYTNICFKYPQNEGRTKTGIKYLRDKNLGRHVLDLWMGKINDPLELSQLFPNLKSFRLYNSCAYTNWNESYSTSFVQTWKRLNVIHEDFPIRDSLTVKLLAAPLHMVSLSSITINFGLQHDEALPMFINQLIHAPALGSLTLQRGYLSYLRLDSLHEGAPNLKHLELKYVESLFVEMADDLVQYYPLPMSSSVSDKLCIFSVTFLPVEEGQHQLPNWDLSYVYWIEYICRKYTNLTRITVASMEMLDEDITTDYLQKAFCNWTQLNVFNRRLVYLSAGILQAMVDGAICLEKLEVYIRHSGDVKQFFNLANSKQKNSINKLVTHDENYEWPVQQQDNLAYFLLSLDENNSQLKAIDIHSNTTVVDHHLIKPT